MNLKVIVTLQEVPSSPDSISHLCVSELILSVTPQVGGVLAQEGLEMGRSQVR